MTIMVQPTPTVIALSPLIAAVMNAEMIPIVAHQ
jgi:hypothetical protein